MIPGIVAGYPVVGGGGGDPYWDDVISLLHFDGSDGSTTFTDAAGGSWSPAGDAQIDTARKKFGTGAMLLGGENDWIERTASGFGFGTGDFTIEMQLYRNGDTSRGTGAAATFLDMRSAVPQTNIAIILTGSTDSVGAIRIALDIGGVVVISSSNNVVGASFSHVALCRVSGVTRLFIDGAQQGASYTDTNNYASTTIRLGARAIIADTYRSLNGSIDEFRVTRAGRYTSNFTPPTAPFPNS